MSGTGLSVSSYLNPREVDQVISYRHLARSCLIGSSKLELLTTNKRKDRRCLQTDLAAGPCFGMKDWDCRHKQAGELHRSALTVVLLLDG